MQNKGLVRFLAWCLFLVCAFYLSFSVVVYRQDKKAKEYAEDEGKDNKEKDDDSDWVVGKSGKMIWYGTKNAVKASR